MPYTPDLGIEYPKNPDEHFLELKKLRDITVDENYPYLDKSFNYLFMRYLMHLGIFVLVFPLIFFRFGLKIEGKSVLKKHRKLLKNGAMTVSNHVHRWDFLMVLQALRYRLMYFPAWKENLSGPDMDLIRLAGGIPVPEDIHSIKFFNQAFDEIVSKKIWIHVFPEGANWHYYQPIRPFKKGVFTMAYRYNLPLLPMAFCYDEPHFPLTVTNLFRKRKLPAIILRIGEPLLPDTDLPRKEAVQKLRKECHEAMVSLAGISENPWAAEGD